MPLTGMTIRLCLTLLTGGLASACGRGTDPDPNAMPAPLTTTVASAAGGRTPRAQELYTAKCAVCHGPTGAGNGPGAAALDPKPRSLRDPQWQASTTDDRIRRVIVDGGPAVGLAPSMPGNPALKTDAATTDALVALVRDFGK